jgi:peptidyl-prolyl cis-trans isomerase SurA
LSDANEFRDLLRKKGLVDETLLKISDRDKILKDQEQLVRHLILERVLDSEVKRQELEVTIEKVEREIRSIARSNGLSRSQLKETLSAQGVDFADYQDFVKKSLERKALIEKEITSRIRISEEDVAAYYLNKYGQNDSQVFELSLAQIVVPKGKDEATARKKIEDLRQRLLTGADFEDMANRFSEDPNFSQGGALGTFKENELNREYQKIVKDLSPGQISNVIVSGSSFVILKLKKRSLTANPAIQARQKEIENVLLSQEFDRKLRSWLNQRLEASFVRLNN